MKIPRSSSLIVLVLALVVLFLFPEPETNFLWYALTGFLFLAVLLLLSWQRHRRG
ncbi:MAG: hypothetical protein GXP63_03135 [DPANN group archaeon]|nr:hypothetical protein [DPANN group archaeon]